MARSLLTLLWLFIWFSCWWLRSRCYTIYIHYTLVPGVIYIFNCLTESPCLYVSRDVCCFPKNINYVSTFALCSQASFLSKCLQHAFLWEHWEIFSPLSAKPVKCKKCTDRNPVLFIIVMKSNPCRLIHIWLGIKTSVKWLINLDEIYGWQLFAVRSCAW